jgi:hypothetical protein
MSSANGATAPVCRNGHPRMNEAGSSNLYTYPPREGRRPKFTCRICRDGLPREMDARSARAPSIFEEFDVRKVRPRKAEVLMFEYLRGARLLDAWAEGMVVAEDQIVVGFFAAINRKYPVRSRMAVRLALAEFDRRTRTPGTNLFEAAEVVARL